MVEASSTASLPPTPPAKVAVIVVGSGAREHALAWKLAQSPRIARLIVAPGNDGMPASAGGLWERWEFTGARDTFAGFAARCVAEKIALVVVGPDNPLADGLVNVLEEHGVRAFGPRAEAARIEASKSFAKEVMLAASVPTARHRVVPNAEEARKFLQSAPWDVGWVLKADGLALGKGVHVCRTPAEAEAALAALARVVSPGPPGPTGPLVIEERLEGEEISWMALCDGEGCVLLDTARDYKRVGDGDRGPNTGGMGAFSPVGGVPDTWAARVREKVFLPVLNELQKRNASFRGVLYAGLMVDVQADRFWVIEFNARFGDPEAQVVLPRFEGDLLPWLEACAEGDLGRMPAMIPFTNDVAVYVVGAARGYPENPERGKAIDGIRAGDENWFFAGVKSEGTNLLTQGGRVFGALGRAATLGEARTHAYSRMSQARFEGLQFRNDIGAGGAP